MSGAALAFLAGLTILLAALFVVVFAWWREAALLARLATSETRTDAADKLRGVIGDGAVGLEHALTSKRAVDDALAQALALVSQSPLGSSLVLGLIVDTLLVVGALAPFLVGLLGAAGRVAALPQVIAAGDAPYVTAVSAIPAAFAGVAQGAKLSVLLVMIAALVVVCRYALLRPEAREARALAALVHATANGAPDARVPQSAKLLSLLAPSRRLGSAVWASFAFVLMSSAAVGALVVATPLRAVNAVPLAYRGWPSLFVNSVGVDAPAVAAGRALEAGPSLIIGRDQVQLGGTVVTELEKGALPADWPSRAIIGPGLTAAARPLVLANATAPMQTVLGVMAHLGTSHGVREFQLVVQRHPPSVLAVEKRVQAAFSASIGDAAAESLVLDMTASEVRMGGAPLDLTRVDGLRQLRAAVGAHARKIGVRLVGELSYGRLIEVLALADGLCDGGVDCGLPGRGVTVVLTTAPAE